jgi:hypothetical protein
MGSDVKRNAFGIVREAHYGLFSSDVTVELADGTGRVRLPARDVRRTGGSGDGGAYALARDWHKAKRFASFVLAIPVLLAIARFVIAGGQPSDLALPVLEESIRTFFALLAGPVGGIVILALVAVFIRRKLNRE